MHRVIYVCFLIAFSILITWVVFAIGGFGHNHLKPPVAIEHYNPPDEQTITPELEPAPTITEPATPVVQPPAQILVPVPRAKSHPRPRPHYRSSPVVPQPHCLFSDEVTGEGF